MEERLVVTLKVMSLNLGKGKSFFMIKNKVTESMTMVAPSREQVKSLKSYRKSSISLFSKLGGDSDRPI